MLLSLWAVKLQTTDRAVISRAIGLEAYAFGGLEARPGDCRSLTTRL